MFHKSEVPKDIKIESEIAELLEMDCPINKKCKK